MTEAKLKTANKSQQIVKTTKENTKKDIRIQISYGSPSDNYASSKGIRCTMSKERLIFLSILIFVINFGIVIYGIFACSKPPLIVEKEIMIHPEIDSDPEPVDRLTSLQGSFKIISRYEWLAQPAIKPMTPLNTPVSLVILHHTATEPCSTKPNCILQIRTIQDYHIMSRHWSDIAYNFLVGGDGHVYEGRGWTLSGSHTRGYNIISLGIGFIGTFTTSPPLEGQIRAFHKLLEEAMRLGYLSKKYQISGANQLSTTASPGKAFFEVLKTWDHWINTENTTSPKTYSVI